jgi:DNA-binding transcriptional LysR family regulator
MRVIVAIAEHGSAKQAAAALHLSPSSVSHTLLGAELELGVELFHRLPKGMTPTSAGTAFVAGARRTLNEADLARAIVDEVRGVMRGVLTVIAAQAYTVALADLVGHFARTFPDVVVRVLPAQSDAGVGDAVRSGSCELGFTRDGPDHRDLKATPLGLEPPVLVVPDGHPLGNRASVTVQDLADERFVAPLADSALRPYFEASFAEAGFAPNVVAEAGTIEMVLELVRAGVGCAISSAMSTATIVGRGAIAVPLDRPKLSKLVLIHRADQPLTPAARAFVELAAG